MESEWKPYPRNRKVRYAEDYAVIVPSSYGMLNESMPLFCEVCNIRFGHQEDEKAYNNFGCCVACADTWAYSRKQEWESGWRPNPEQVKLVVEKRSIVNPVLVFE